MPLPMTAILRPVMCPPSRPADPAFWRTDPCLLACGSCLLACGSCLLACGSCLLAYGSLFAADRGPDWRPGGLLATEQVPQRPLQVRLAELVPGLDQPLRSDVLAGLGDFPGPLVAE